MKDSVKRAILGICLFLLAGAAVFAGGQSSAPAAGGANAPVSITVEVFDRGTDGGRSDPTNNNWTKWIQEKLLKDENISVTFVPIPRGQEGPGLITLMAAGDAPDICYTYGADLINTFRLQGGLFEMTPYVDSHMPDLKKWLGEDEALPGKLLINRQITPDGKLYAVPARRMALGLAYTGAFIRKDWLDKLGLPVPTTTEEFYNAIKAFKDKNPGNVSNILPIVFGDTVGGTTAMHMRGAFLDPKLSDKDRWIYGVETQPGYKETYRLLNRMYNEGLIDKDFALYNDGGTTTHNNLKSGRAGFYVADRDHPYRNSPGIQDGLALNVPGAQFVPIDPFKNSEGKTPKDIYDPQGILSFIPVYSKAPEAAMRYLNWLSIFENRYFLQVGPEGIVHDIVDGIPQLKRGEGLWIQNSDQNLDYTIPINGMDLGDPIKNENSVVNAFPAEYRDLIIEAYAMSLKDGRAPPVVSGVELIEATKYPELGDKWNDVLVQAITCPIAQFDRVWDDGIKAWLAAGQQAVIDERKAKYPY
ncbi:MAG: extracellular solute-binding protein [Treponema sp.]|jgi:putative aldouronate transport system substrate-binding protein|nr:extracellular solute-binding protein [Treponema sp.]